VAWIAWKGRHPDPSLFMLETDLAQAGVAAAADRGPVPAPLAAPGWTEGDVSLFDSDNLYEKIDGREGYYKSFGFERLYFVSIVSTEDSQAAVDIELYDLGNAANAVGAYSGERSPGVSTAASESGLTHIERNAMYLTRGRFYLRAIGSEESPRVRTQLERLQGIFGSELPGEPLPWGYALFVGRMGVDPGALVRAPDPVGREPGHLERVPGQGHHHLVPAGRRAPRRAGGAGHRGRRALTPRIQAPAETLHPPRRLRRSPRTAPAWCGGPWPRSGAYRWSASAGALLPRIPRQGAMVAAPGV